MAASEGRDGGGNAGFERDLEQRVLLRVWLLGLLFLGGVALTNVLTLLTEAERAGEQLDWREPWILEGTSILVLAALVPAVAALERRFPFTNDTWRSALVAHLLGSMAFSALHVAAMLLLRLVLYRAVLGRNYSYFTHPLSDALYEYRKDLLPYAVIILLLGLTRNLFEARREAQLARNEAQRSGRLTLKSGGRVLLVDGPSFAWGSSAGNYVEVLAGGRRFLARITLKALEQQLADAGISVARIHRSTIINARRMSEVIPGQDGDFRVRLDDGTLLKGSRRFRAGLTGGGVPAGS